MHIKKLILLLIIYFSLNSLFSQNYIQFSQYINTQGLLNPAYSGTKSSINGLLIYRNQWVNMAGAPVNFAFNIHAPIKTKKMGIGISAINEQIGMRNQTNINVAYSYITKINSKKSLSFGLRIGIKNYNFDKSKAQLIDIDDPFFTNGNESFLLPDFGFGAYYYTKRFFAGLSLPNLLTNGLDTYSTTLKTNSFSLKQQHYYLYSGYIFKLNDKFLIKPSVLGKYIYGASLQFNVNSSLLVKEILWLGLGYRTGEALIFLLDYKINEQISLAYSYDWVLNKLNKYNSGSHEIMLLFNIYNKTSTLMFNSPRNF